MISVKLSPLLKRFTLRDKDDELFAVDAPLYIQLSGV
jgi:hypothetical protein